MNFGKKIKNLRIKQGKNQRDAAKSIGIDQSYLSLLENDRCVPSEDIFNRLADTYKVNSNELLMGINPAAIYRDFNHISTVAAKLDDYKKSAKESYRHIFIASIISCCVGVLIVITGLSGILQSNTIYNYGTITKKQLYLSENYRPNSYKNINAEGSVWFESLPYEELIKENYHYVYFFSTRHFLGNKTNQGAPVEHAGISSHKLIAEIMELGLINRWIIFVGILLIFSGTAGFVVERQLRFLKPT